MRIEFMITVKAASWRQLMMTLLLAVFPLTNFAQNANVKSRGDASARPTKTDPSPQVQPGVMVTQAFMQRGVNNCAERVGQFSQFLTSGGEVGGQVFVAPEDADRRIASASLEIQVGAAIGYAGMTFSPDSGANRCGAAYELISYWPNSCQEVATKAYPTYKLTAPLRKTVLSLDGGTTVRVFLMPAGTGCVSIKKEITY